MDTMMSDQHDPSAHGGAVCPSAQSCHQGCAGTSASMIAMAAVAAFLLRKVFR